MSQLSSCLRKLKADNNAVLELVFYTLKEVELSRVLILLSYCHVTILLLSVPLRVQIPRIIPLFVFCTLTLDFRNGCMDYCPSFSVIFLANQFSCGWRSLILFAVHLPLSILIASCFYHQECSIIWSFTGMELLFPFSRDS